MTLLQLKYVSMVAKYGSFSKAAQQLYVTQPGISKMVHSLEEELGITIFLRSPAGITLTPEGKDLVDMGNRLLSDADEIADHFISQKETPGVSLAVSSAHFCFAVDAMTTFLNRHESEEFNVKHLMEPIPDILRQVHDKSSEIGVLFLGEHNKRTMKRSLEDYDLIFHELIVTRPYIFIHKDHPLAGHKTILTEELDPYPCIIYQSHPDAPSVLQEEVFVPYFMPKRTVTISGLYQSCQVMREHNGYDMGAGLVCYSNDLEGVIAIPVENFTDQVVLGWISRKNHELSPAAQEYVEIMEELCTDFNPEVNETKYSRELVK